MLRIFYYNTEIMIQQNQTTKFSSYFIWLYYLQYFEYKKNAWRLYAWHIKNQQVICVLRNFQRLFLYLTYLNWQFTCPPHKPSGLNFCTKQEKFYISNKIVFPRFIIISRLCETHIYISCGHEGLSRKLCAVVFYCSIVYLFNKIANIIGMESSLSADTKLQYCGKLLNIAESNLHLHHFQ